jgi:magnesium-transporting ATPase (P-type)
MNQQLVDYVKDGLSKGYTEDQLRKILLDHGVAKEEANEALQAAKGVLVEKRETVKETVPPQTMDVKDITKQRLYASIVTLAGIVLMIIVYLFRIFFLPEPTQESTGAVAFIKAFWPFVFPVIANIVNFVYFRKKFVLGLAITIITILILVLFIIILMMGA